MGLQTSVQMVPPVDAGTATTAQSTSSDNPSNMCWADGSRCAARSVWGPPLMDQASFHATAGPVPDTCRRRSNTQGSSHHKLHAEQRRVT